MNPAQHKSQAMKFQKAVYLYGTAGDVYEKGEALCYNRDYGTATDREGERDKRVERPSTTNNMDFAGVLDHKVTLPDTGMARVIINEPGSVCDVAVGSDTVVNSTYLWPVVGDGGAGRFRSDTGAKIGVGAAKALQTNASGNLGESIDGTATVNGTAVTKTGLFANASAGDKLVILSSVSAAGAAGGTPGVYTIDSVTNDNSAVLTASASSGAVEIMAYVISGNPTVLCELLKGDQCGLVEWLAPLDNAAAQSMVGGATHLQGGITLGAGDSTATLADGTFPGQDKAFYLHGALTTQDYLLTVTSGIQVDGSTALATLEFDGDGDYARLEWFADEWTVKNLGGAAQA